LVDTQHLLGRLFSLSEEEPHTLVQYYSDPYDDEVDFVFLNTCGFISSARDEATHTIEKLAKYGKKIYLLGCAVQYYKNLNTKGTPSPKTQDSTQNIYTLSRNDFDALSLKNLIN
jgi:tRNA A37 methylthiotransferase MiaB